MASNRQVAANRRNAAKSTGPRTKRGKEVVSKNAMRHGLTAQHLLVPGESEDEFEALIQRLISEFDPEGEFEIQLVERISTCIWRQRRIYRIESEILRAQYLEAEITRLRNFAVLYMSDAGEMSPRPVFFRSDADEAAYEEIMAVRHKVRADMAHADVSLGKAFVGSNERADTLSKLSRHEATIERALYRAHHELLRLQAQRRGESGMVPHAVDVQVDRSD